MITKVKISAIKTNPDNPRVIKDNKFKQLVKSIREFPQMLELRPIVVNDEMMVLGGNMRLKACKEAGLEEVHILQAKDLSPEQQREFIIKDNISFGEWDWDAIKEDWNTGVITDWGMDVNFMSDFSPVLNPYTDFGDVTSQEVEKKAKELAEAMFKDNKFQEVTCPNCGEDFDIESK